MQWCIFVERMVGTRFIMISCVIQQQVAQVPFTEHHDMVETFASDRSDQPLDTTILPWRARRGLPVANAHGLQATGDRGAIRGVAG